MITFVIEKSFIMKKYLFVVVVTLLVAFLAGSCNRETCPAYSNASGQSTDNVG